MPRAKEEEKTKKPKRRLLERTIQFWERHRVPLIIIAMGIIALIVLLSITKSYLTIQFLLGNDLLVEANGVNTSIEVGTGTRVTLPMSVTVTTNPFCEATCTNLLRDIATGDALYTETFTVRTGDPYETTREVVTPSRGAGQTLYRHEITCAAARTAWCHTGGIPVTRDVLITIDYGPTPETIARRSQAKEDVLRIARKAQTPQASNDAIAADLLALNANIDVDDLFALLAIAQDAHAQLAQAIDDARARWDEQDDEGFAQAATRAQETLTRATTASDIVRNATTERINHQRASVAWLTASYDVLVDIAHIPTDNITLQARRNATFATYDTTRILLTHNRASTQTRANALSALATAVTELANDIAIDERVGTLTSDANAGIALDALCTAGITCRTHPSILELANETALNRTMTCTRIENSTTVLAVIRATAVQDSVERNLTGNATLVAMANGQAQERLRLARNDALAALATTLNAPNTATLIAALSSTPAFAAVTLNSTGIEPLVTIALIDAYPTPCPVLANVTIVRPQITPYTASTITPTPSNLTLPDMIPQCCALGECRACCDTETCRATLQPPVLFIHGHAFNQGTSAQYSLDAFDLMQRRLESDGWLDTGTIVLSETIRDRAWTRASVPISAKASYYLDVYAGPDNAVLVQTKSENIDTYVLKLNDIITETRRRTGQDKVIIVAHSMGGLVTRRYLQVFGDAHIERVVMFGTPNHGIEGSIADYCGLLGEDLECRDMRAGSLFLNKLEQSGDPIIPVSVIIGRGCDTDGADGDGVVTADNAKLPYATLRYINGTCDGFTTLHTAMLDIERYPQAYEYLLEAIQE